MSPTRSRTWLALMFATAFSGMIYELALAQLLGGLTGSALMRFATTVGVYVAGLGVGSLVANPVKDQRTTETLVRAELALFIVGFASPFLFTLFYWSACQLTIDAGDRSLIVLASTHAVIFLTGFLSGFELPLLSALSDNSMPNSSSQILASDYAGMFAASLSFPLLLFPIFGLISTFMIATAVNLSAALLTVLTSRRLVRLEITMYVALALLNLAGFIFSDSLQAWLGHIYVTST